MEEARQLPLPFVPQTSYAGVDFIAAPSNAAALAWLARPADWPFARLALYGPKSSGKTHLLHVWCVREAGTLWSAADVVGVPVLPSSGPVGVDDADLAEEAALFHLINAAAQAGRPLLLVGRAAPSRWGTCLPDLASRLRATTSVGIGAAEDVLLERLLVRLLAEHQLEMPLALQTWLRARLPRDAAALMEAVARLDRLALAHGRGMTRVLAAMVLRGMGDMAEEAFLPPPSPCAPAFL